jgi:hypothetical protein
MVMMAALALVVDIGYAWGRRRMAQNVADSGAVAATKIVAKDAAVRGSERDATVLQAIRDVATRSSGGFVLNSTSGPPGNCQVKGGFTDCFTAWYVDKNLARIPGDAGIVGKGEAPCPAWTGIPKGCIPSDAWGVRVAPNRTNSTFFAPVLGVTELGANARATALASPVTGTWGPYAIWGGELRHRCRLAIDPNSPPPQGNPDWYEADPADPSHPFKLAGRPGTADGQYVYGCIPWRNGTQITHDPGGTPPRPAQRDDCPADWDGTSCPTRVIYRSQQYRAAPNINDGDEYDRPEGHPARLKRWRVGDSRFKGFLHASSGFLDLLWVRQPVPVDISGGISDGNQPLTAIDNCYQNREPPVSCTLLMPIISQAEDYGNQGVKIWVEAFVALKLLNGSSETQDWIGQFVRGGTVMHLVLTEGVQPDPNAPTAYYVRLVE